MRGQTAGQPTFRGVLPGHGKRVTEPGLQADSPRPRSLTGGFVTVLGSTGFRPRKGSFCWSSPSAGQHGNGPAAR